MIPRGCGAGLAALTITMAGIGCGPTVRPGSANDDTPVRRIPATPRHGQGSAPARAVLLGEMCPQGAGGRPGIAPLVLRAVGWTSDEVEVSAPIQRNALRSMAVLGWDGRRAGVFSVLGAADAGLPQDVAIGSYAGGSPCGQPGGQASADDARCVRAQRGCGLAIGDVSRDAAAAIAADDQPREVVTGGACVVGDALAVDIDGDGVVEAYPVAQFLDPLRAPAEEVFAVPADGAACAPAFSIYGLLPGIDPKYLVSLDLAGVIDIDGDGRRELIMAYRYAENRTLAVFSAPATLARLELVAEAVPWK